MDVWVKFGDFTLQMAELLDSLLASSALRTFVQYLIAFCRRQEAAVGVISGKFVGPIVPDKLVKLFEPPLNRSGEIQPKLVGCGISAGFSNLDNCRP